MNLPLIYRKKITPHPCSIAPDAKFKANTAVTAMRRGGGGAWVQAAIGRSLVQIDPGLDEAVAHEAPGLGDAGLEPLGRAATARVRGPHLAAQPLYYRQQLGVLARALVRAADAAAASMLLELLGLGLRWARSWNRVFTISVGFSFSYRKVNCKVRGKMKIPK